MPFDDHFQTGEYEPRRYWDRRAEKCRGDLWRTVCGYELSIQRNRAMDRIQRHLLARFLGRHLAGRQTLDFGCGAGRLTGWFLTRGAFYTGVDVSPKMLARARGRHPEAGLGVIGDHGLPFSDGCFDIAVTVTVLQHNPYEAQRELLIELLRVVRPGGLLLLIERIGDRRHPGTLFTLFPRPLNEWVSEVTRGEEAVLEKCRLVRWWITFDTAMWVTRRLSVRLAERLGTLERFLVPLGSRIDPMLMPLLPASKATAAAMLFRKRV